MKYKIERALLGGNYGVYVPSDSYPNTYTLERAKDILALCVTYGLSYRMVAVTTPTPKPYRRHAAVTPLELRGAYAMLESAILYLTYGTNNAAASYRDACTVLAQAKRAVRSQLLG